METKNITAKILDDAKKNAEEIVFEAEGKLKSILENAREEARGIGEKLEKETEELVRKETARILSLAEMEEKKKILQEKIKILEETFHQALDHFQAKSEKEYERIMRGLLMKSVNHGDEEYVRDDVHINTAESWFALLKRGVHGTFHHVSSKHLDRYVDESVFRWDRRKGKDGERAVAAIKATEGKRLYYSEPIGLTSK